MAEKKFFVDINLQGSALTNAKIGTNSGIGSTEGAFGFDSASHRLQYFDGTATKDVANLSDISAVTGGLIFQGGCDPYVDTSDITDGTALKGFFWAATAEGTFLGEDLQVGDSVIAKVDNAGATIADWLILQGNTVIALDSVYGITRLATQTEANDGTGDGGVVITPATLQGKIDAQITPEISSKLPLAGGTMSGEIDMGGNRVTGLAEPTSGEDATNRFYVDNAANTARNDAEATASDDATTKADAAQAAANAYTDTGLAAKLNLAGGTMSGAINMDNNDLTNVRTLYTSSEGSLGSPYLNTDHIGQYNGSDVKLSSDINAQNTQKIINLPAPTADGDAANKTYVDDNTSNKLPLAGGTMSGNINMGDNDVITGNGAFRGDGLEINNVYSKNGTTVFINTDLSLQNNSIKNLPAPTADGDATNKLYVDTNTNNKLPLAGGFMSGDIDMSQNSISNLFLENVRGIDMNGNSITNVLEPTLVFDATNKGYVDNAVSTAQTAAIATASADASEKANAAETDAKQYADSLAPNYDAAGAAAQALTDANAYADSLAPNYDAAGSAATAESNANDYTDTAVSALSGKITIPVSGWLTEATGYYQFIDTSAFGNHQLITQVIDANNQVIELGVMADPESTTVRSNILPSENFYLLVTKVF